MKDPILQKHDLELHRTQLQAYLASAVVESPMADLTILPRRGGKQDTFLRPVDTLLGVLKIYKESHALLQICQIWVRTALSMILQMLSHYLTITPCTAASILTQPISTTLAEILSGGGFSLQCAALEAANKVMLAVELEMSPRLKVAHAVACAVRRWQSVGPLDHPLVPAWQTHLITCIQILLVKGRGQPFLACSYSQGTLPAAYGDIRKYKQIQELGTALVLGTQLWGCRWSVHLLRTKPYPSDYCLNLMLLVSQALLEDDSARGILRSQMDSLLCFKLAILCRGHNNRVEGAIDSPINE